VEGGRDQGVAEVMDLGGELVLAALAAATAVVLAYRGAAWFVVAFPVALSVALLGGWWDQRGTR